jgi:hypothetical protein
LKTFEIHSLTAATAVMLCFDGFDAWGMKCGWGEMKSWRDVRAVRNGGRSGNTNCDCEVYLD